MDELYSNFESKKLSTFTVKLLRLIRGDVENGIPKLGMQSTRSCTGLDQVVQM